MKLTLSIFLLFTLYQLDGQDYKASIHKSFDQYKEAELSDDLPTLVSMAHPEIVKKGGGSAYYTDEIVAAINMYRAGGMEIVDLKMHDIPKVIDTGESLQAIVPYSRIIKKGEEHLEEKNYYLVISVDQGAHWSFTDLNKYDLRSIKLFIPEYNERLNIYVNSTSH